jgi:hypothetical protein
MKRMNIYDYDLLLYIVHVKSYESFLTQLNAISVGIYIQPKSKSRK